MFQRGGVVSMSSHSAQEPPVEERRNLFLAAMGVWIGVTLVFLAVTAQLALELLFVLLLVGLLVVGHVFGPYPERPPWWRVVQGVLVVGLLLFTWLTADHVATVLS
jgi:VIT1/CCC1 family predicted Fe2+/Mn2+ transporter